MALSADNEARLVELAVSGDFDSFAALYSRYLDAIYRYIFYRTGDTQDAEDLTEQVFLNAWQARSNYRPVGSCFVNWLYRIAHNIVVDYHRRRKIITNEPLRSDIVLPDVPQEPALETIILAEECAALALAIARLPEESQQVIILRFIEGLGHAEIAQILDKSEVACRGIQHRALASLNKSLTGQQERV
jgi:RNA polymerase sigma-70 factor (ECF subfamily)